MVSREVAGWSDELRDYFAEKADTYNERGDEPYWRLSDDLLWLHISKYLSSIARRPFTFLDAGAGTGRWSVRVLREFKQAHGTLFDVSPDMLRVAERDLKASIESERWTIIPGDLDRDLSPQMGTFDFIMCFHNVLGFVKDADTVLAQLAERLAPQGILLFMLPNKYHAFYFSLLRGSLDEVNRILEASEVRYSSGPPMRVFTGSEVATALRRCGLSVECYGFPVTMYPVPSASYARAAESLSEVLMDKASFQKMLALEWKLSQDPELAPRGNNLLVAARAR